MHSSNSNAFYYPPAGAFLSQEVTGKRSFSLPCVRPDLLPEVVVEGEEEAEEQLLLGLNAHILGADEYYHPPPANLVNMGINNLNRNGNSNFNINNNESKLTSKHTRSQSISQPLNN